MNISDIVLKMVCYSNGNHNGINHFLKVYVYAKTIVEHEGLSAEEVQIVEIAAILHDIACPLCRKKHGNRDGKHQETEGMILAKEFLKDMGLPERVEERIVFLVGHHHTFEIHLFGWINRPETETLYYICF